MVVEMTLRNDNNDNNNNDNNIINIQLNNLFNCVLKKGRQRPIESYHHKHRYESNTERRRVGEHGSLRQ
jgi:hypothetical protein